MDASERREGAGSSPEAAEHETCSSPELSPSRSICSESHNFQCGDRQSNEFRTYCLAQGCSRP